MAMEPSLQYARTADGVSIAFSTLGEGEPLVYLVGGPWNHIELWEVPECRWWYERLARDRMLVRYDVRGTGLSEREVIDFSLGARVLDLEAVLDRLEVDTFNLFAAVDAGPVAITYAVRHPERVSRLLLWCSFARAADIASPRLRAWRGLIDQDWELMTDTCVHLALGWSGGEVGHTAAEHLRDSVTRDVAKASLAAADTVDVTGLLHRVRQPTLVLHRRGIPWLSVDVARGLASGIPGALLKLVEGESTAPYLGDTEAAAQAIEQFLDTEDAPRVQGKEPHVPSVSSVQHPAALAQPRPAPSDGLTAREVQVLRLVASGQTNSEIADELVLSIRTVERHIANIYGKIGARGRANATAYALTRALV